MNKCIYEEGNVTAQNIVECFNLASLIGCKLEVTMSPFSLNRRDKEGHHWELSYNLPYDLNEDGTLMMALEVKQFGVALDEISSEIRIEALAKRINSGEASLYVTGEFVPINFPGTAVGLA